MGGGLTMEGNGNCEESTNLTVTTGFCAPSWNIWTAAIVWMGECITRQTKLILFLSSRILQKVIIHTL